eukprot:m.262303 g.262303  ORF g.262303 m.262303 type:complete len:805 (+) comp16004_c0_seq1:2908-5322(+)
MAVEPSCKLRELPSDVTSSQSNFPNSVIHTPPAPQNRPTGATMKSWIAAGAVALAVALTVDSKSINPRSPSFSIPPGVLRARFNALSTPAQARATAALQQLGGPFVNAAAQDDAYDFDAQGNLFAADPGMSENRRRSEELKRTRRAGELPTPDSYDANGLPIHHSRPGATNTLYLAFQGGVISGTAWGSGATYTTFPYRKNSITDLTRDATDQARISEIFLRVAEDYAPFDVDVTTQMPVGWPSNLNDNRRIGTLIFTQSNGLNGPNPHSGYGGIAYVNVWGQSNFGTTYSPAWVQDYGPASASEAASHEAGHNLGLSHDSCSSCTSGYQADFQSTGGIWFGPIMGVSYGADVSQFSKGDYFEATQTQNDMTIIDGKLGRLADDHTTTPIAVSGTDDVTVTGIIERALDTDTFTFAAGAGTQIAITASSYHPSDTDTGSNLYFTLTVSGSVSGTLCSITGGGEAARLNPTWSASTCSPTTSAAETVSIAITGAESADTSSNYNGPLFPAYASVGTYKIRVQTTTVNCPTGTLKAGNPPGECGCDVADTDSDGDGTADCVDGCPADASKTAAGQCGCGNADTDSDGDGTADCNDACASDPSKTAPGACGCGVADTDSDGDGTPDCNDACPNDVGHTTSVPACGCPSTPITPCNGNGICEAGEDCTNSADCIGGTTSGAVCGNNICETGAGEDCSSCPSDCNGVTGGKPSNRYCCGSTVTCSDARCSDPTRSCSTGPVTASYCCGDGTCTAGAETSTNCNIDCSGPPPPPPPPPPGCGGSRDPCTGNGDCCSLNCRTSGRWANTCS